MGLVCGAEGLVFAGSLWEGTLLLFGGPYGRGEKGSKCICEGNLELCA